MWRSRRFFLLLLAFTALFSLAVSGQEGRAGFLQLTLNRSFTIPFFEVFFDEKEQPYLHFTSLMTALELPIEFEPALGSATGVLADGETPFNLNLERMTVEVGRVTHRLPANAVRLEKQGLFLLWSELAAWLPIRIEWSLEAYEITIATQYHLPSLARQERELERRRLFFSQEEVDREALAAREPPFFEPGMVELKAAATATDRNERLSLNLFGVHRFLGGDLEYSLTEQSRSDEESEFIVDFFRLKYSDDFRTKELTVGDTFTTFSPLVLATATFRGASFFTGGALNRFGRAALVGTAPPGSEVDLYRLGVLIAFTRTDDNGFYQFDGLALSQQTTLFEVRIFTPQGRRFSEFKVVSSQEEMVGGGELATQGGAGESLQDQNPYTFSGAEARYGLFSNVTVGAYALQLENFRTDAGEVIEALQASGLFGLLRPFEWGVFLAELAQDSALPGSGTRLGGFFSFSNASLEVEERSYTEEFSPPARQRSTAFGGISRVLDTLQAILRTRFFLINASFTARKLDFGDARAGQEREVRLDRRITKGLSLAVSLFQERFSDGSAVVSGADTTETLATFRLGLLSRVELLVGTASPVNGEETQQVRATYLKVQQSDSPLGYRASYTTRTNSEDTGEVSLTYLFANHFRLSGQTDTLGGWQITLDYTLPIRVSSDGFETFRPGFFGRAGIEGVVYLDENSDGFRQPLEPTLPDVRIVAPGITDLVTDSGGSFKGWGLPTSNPVAVEIDLLTTDALFTPLKRKNWLAAHPGELIHLDIPLVPSGGVTGLFTTRVPRSISPANGITIILERAGGDPFAFTKVEWDGSFILEGIPPGDYVLYGKREDLAARGLQTTPDQVRLTFPGGGEPSWMEGIEFQIVRRGGGELPGGRSPGAADSR